MFSTAGIRKSPYAKFDWSSKECPAVRPRTSWDTAGSFLAGPIKLGRKDFFYSGCTENECVPCEWLDGFARLQIIDKVLHIGIRQLAETKLAHRPGRVNRSGAFQEMLVLVIGIDDVGGGIREKRIVHLEAHGVRENLPSMASPPRERYSSSPESITNMFAFAGSVFAFVTTHCPAKVWSAGQ